MQHPLIFSLLILTVPGNWGKFDLARSGLVYTARIATPLSGPASGFIRIPANTSVMIENPDATARAGNSTGVGCDL